MPVHFLYLMLSYYLSFCEQNCYLLLKWAQISRNLALLNVPSLLYAVTHLRICTRFWYKIQIENLWAKFYWNRRGKLDQQWWCGQDKMFNSKLNGRCCFSHWKGFQYRSPLYFLIFFEVISECAGSIDDQNVMTMFHRIKKQMEEKCVRGFRK